MAEPADIGMVGLGVMGANLALNLAEHGFRVAVYDRDFSKADALAQGEYGARFVTCSTEDALLAAIAPPRPVLMLVPAGEPTDDAIRSLSKLASPGDVLIDAGNSDFHDTRRRTAQLEVQGLSFLGIGVSGGAEGARTGPAMMAGGSQAIWGRVAPMLQAIAARYGDVPCADWFGPDGAGHFVKTVHNGIEYADMQMIAEVYGLMRDGLAQDASFIGATFSEWAVGPLASSCTPLWLTQRMPESFGSGFPPPASSRPKMAAKAGSGEIDSQTPRIVVITITPLPRATAKPDIACTT